MATKKNTTESAQPIDISIPDIDKPNNIDIVLYAKEIDKSLSDVTITLDMAYVLNSLELGYKLSDIIKHYGIPLSRVSLWQKQNKLFSACMDLIRELLMECRQSDMIAESYDKASDNLNMFTSKKWFPEYRDNATIDGEKLLNISINLIGSDGKQLERPSIDITPKVDELPDKADK